MRSFWIRIFATFWLIEIFTIAGVVTLRGRLEDFGMHPLSEKAMVLMAFSAEEAYQAGQCSALGLLFRRFEQVYDIRPYLFDGTGHAVCRVFVSQTVQRAANTAKSATLIHAITRDQTVEKIAAIQLDSAQNTHYTYVAETDEVPAWLYRFRAQFMLLASLLVSGAITALLAKILVRPIGRLRSTALDLAAGNLKARARGAKGEPCKGDEVAGLVHDFNRMADQIETLVGNQKQLVRDVSHELRSPLSRLSVALELLREDTNEQSMVHVERIEREADRLNRLIGQLLDLSRMEAIDGGNIGKEIVDLENILNDVVENARYEASARNCNVRAVSVEQSAVYGNPELLLSALENVVRNAIRYTDQGTDVVVTLEQRHEPGGQMASLTVRDFGPGVPENKIPSLCLPFYRVDPARSNETGGTGVGLAIADRAVRLHGGSLALRNHPLGGFEVSLLLPLFVPRTEEDLPQLALSTADPIS